MTKSRLRCFKENRTVIINLALKESFAFLNPTKQRGLHTYPLIIMFQCYNGNKYRYYTGNYIYLLYILHYVIIHRAHGQLYFSLMP